MSSGILGINARNLLYIHPYNSKKAIRLADDKLKTKHFLSARGIPVPRMYSQIRSYKELERFDFDILPDSFVIKPNCGFGGEGIIPILHKEHNEFITSTGKQFSLLEVKEHIRDILDGRFALSQGRDTAFFEQLIVPDEAVGKYSYKGLPDIRVVVYNLIPVMAMLRLPTKRSAGRANLHQGAIGVGIDIARGEATYVSQGGNIIDGIPGIGGIRKLKIPYWDDILLISSKIQLITNLGYLAVDIVIDKHSGPLLLEINARAGLGVQIANLAPLRRRLDRIQGLKVNTPQKGVRLAKDMFGEQIERNIKHVSGKQVIGTEEQAEIILHGQTYKILAGVDSLRMYSAVSADFARKIGLIPVDQEIIPNKKRYKLKYVLRDVRIQTAVEISVMADDEYKMIIGSRDLLGFLIDPSYKPNALSKPALFESSSLSRVSVPVNFSEIDRRIVDIDRQIRLLYYLRPLNLSDEIQKFSRDRFYNPQFAYPDFVFSPQTVRSVLSSLKLDDSILGELYRKKIEEILKKLDVLEMRGTPDFPHMSQLLFGLPLPDDVLAVQPLIQEYVESLRHIPEENLSSKQAAAHFKHVLDSYGLSQWKVVLKENMVSNVLAGKDATLFVSKKARFSQKRLNSLVVHEVETHILTAENGNRQPYRILGRGTGYYLKTQEGLAVYNQRKVLGEVTAIGVSVLAVDRSRNSSFSQVYEFLMDMGLSHERALKLCVKVKRGLTDTTVSGGFSKEWIYFQGFRDIAAFVDQGGDLKRLYVGKLALEDLSLIEKISGLAAPTYLPVWL